MKNKRVGLVLAHTGTSYGMNLQALATQRLVESMGFETEILRMKSGELKNVQLDWGLPFFIFKFIFARIKMRRYDNNIYEDEVHKNNHTQRILAAQNFRDRYLKNISPILSSSELKAYTNRFQSVLIGSDQCWLPGFAYGMFNSLRFVPPHVKRISYATSLGVSAYPKYCYPSSRKVWNSFNYISVRENQGRNIIKSVCGNNINVEVVLDPTYMVTEDEWLDIIPHEELVKDKYILSFILGSSIDQQECVRRFADTKGLKLVSILSNESSTPIDISYADQLITGKGPDDFVNLIRNAEYVFTDSFHGIAFSIIHKKQLFIFSREDSLAKKSNSRFSRIQNILNTWDISNQFIDNPISWNPSSELPTINYARVGQILEEKRKKSYEYLKKSLL